MVDVLLALFLILLMPGTVIVLWRHDQHQERRAADPCGPVRLRAEERWALSRMERALRPPGRWWWRLRRRAGGPGHEPADPTTRRRAGGEDGRGVRGPR